MSEIINYTHKYLQSGRSWAQRSRNSIDTIVIHHSAYAHDSLTAEDRFRKMMSWHIQRDKSDSYAGWPGLSYHYAISKEGKIYKLNNNEDITFHVGDHNGNCVSILVDGYFSQPYNNNPNNQLQALKEIASELAIELDIDPNRIVGHRDLSATNCPGDHLHPQLANIQRYVKDNMPGKAVVNDGYEYEYYTVRTGGWRSQVIVEIITSGQYPEWVGDWRDSEAKFNQLNPISPIGGWKAGDKVLIKKTKIVVPEPTPIEPPTPEPTPVEPVTPPEEVVDKNKQLEQEIANKLTEQIKDYVTDNDGKIDKEELQRMINAATKVVDNLKANYPGVWNAIKDKLSKVVDKFKLKPVIVIASLVMSVGAGNIALGNINLSSISLGDWADLAEVFVDFGITALFFLLSTITGLFGYIKKGFDKVVGTFKK